MRECEKSKILYLVVDGCEDTILPCTLTRKKIKNINLRINREGEVLVSAPLRTAEKQITDFLQSKSRWVYQAVLHAKEKAAQQKPAPDQVQAERVLRPVFEAYFPLFRKVLDDQLPTLVLREMKSRWGVCYPGKKKIVLNTQLANYPKAAQEYVVLHEYVHFLYPDHGSGFHAQMAALMPDYKARRALLR